MDKFIVRAYASNSGLFYNDISKFCRDFDEALNFYNIAVKDFMESEWSHAKAPEMFFLQKIDPDTYKLLKENKI
jgi:hypothetical protein